MQEQLARQKHAVRQPMGVFVDEIENRPTVRIVGRANRDRVAVVAETIRGLRARGARDLVIDLTDSYDGAELLSVLARERAELSDMGGSMALVGVALPEFLAALRLARLDEVFLVYDAVRRAHPPRRSTPASRYVGAHRVRLSG